MNVSPIDTFGVNVSPVGVSGQEAKKLSGSQPFFSEKLYWSFLAVAGGVQGAIRAVRFEGVKVWHAGGAPALFAYAKELA